ncbi:hypothetical protein HBP99_13810 [Listeria booriae]|uniref:hypothetical protein n=1 Tax=Listeria booriae TaxID=1552123 RepID=UPI00162AC700|nr:hypothetical protein [Listeria booriae]MBC2369718.1 hypothetical protein [Listeria booriae]
MSTFRTINKEFASLGFLVGVPYFVFVKQTGKYTMLIVEGEHLKPRRRLGDDRGASEYLYTFYKARYDREDGIPTNIKVYSERESVVVVLNKVRGHLEFLRDNGIQMK